MFLPQLHCVMHHNTVLFIDIFKGKKSSIFFPFTCMQRFPFNGFTFEQASSEQCSLCRCSNCSVLCSKEASFDVHEMHLMFGPTFFYIEHFTVRICRQMGIFRVLCITIAATFVTTLVTQSCSFPVTLEKRDTKHENRQLKNPQLKIISP